MRNEIIYTNKKGKLLKQRKYKVNKIMEYLGNIKGINAKLILFDDTKEFAIKYSPTPDNEKLVYAAIDRNKNSFCLWPFRK